MNKKLAIVSGGTGHIGSAIGDALREAGWRVIALARETSPADTVMCDVTDDKSVETAIRKITDQHGSIHAVIHAAVAPIENKLLTDISVESFDIALFTAARGAFLLAKAAVPHMQKDAAFIGITTTLIGPQAELMPMGAYIPAKYALHGFLRALAADTKKLGIRVYAVAPGFIAGGLNSGVPKAVLSLLAQKSVAGETTAEEVARVVQQLCTDPNAYPSGSSISIPGEVEPL